MKGLVFLTGTTGQLGSYLAELYLADDHKVIGLKRRTSTDNLWRLKDCIENPNFSLVEGDITDFGSIFQIIQQNRPDRIINAAAMSHVHTSFSQPNYTFDVVAKGPLNLLESIRLLKSDNYNPRFATFSSSEMFGDQFDNHNPFDGSSSDKNIQHEQTKMNPKSPYAVAKLAAFQLGKIYREAYGIWVTNPILFNSESSRRGENFVTRKITKWIGDYLRWKKKCHFDTCGLEFTDNTIISDIGYEFPKLKLGNINSYRDWSYAEDTARGVKLALEYKNPTEFIFATGETHTIKEFVELAFSLVNLNWKDYVTIDKDLFRPSEVKYLCGDSSKARQLLGWQSTVSFKELVSMMVKSDAEV